MFLLQKTLISTRSSALYRLVLFALCDFIYFNFFFFFFFLNVIFWIERLWLLENAEQWMEGHWVCLWSDLCDGMIIIIIIIKLRWALFVTYTIIQSITSSEMCSQHLTHPSAHRPGAVGSRHSRARGAVRGSVPCSRVSPQSWTIPAGAEIQTHNLGLQVRRSIH